MNRCIGFVRGVRPRSVVVKSSVAAIPPTPPCFNSPRPCDNNPCRITAIYEPQSRRRLARCGVFGCGGWFPGDFFWGRVARLPVVACLDEMPEVFCVWHRGQTSSCRSPVEVCPRAVFGRIPPQKLLRQPPKHGLFTSVPAKNAEPHRHIPQSRQKTADFSLAAILSGRTSPVAALWRNFRGSIKQRVALSAGRVRAGQTGS
jgi:hypothetical protein